MKIEIPLKPISVNEAFQGRKFKTKKCKQYEKDIVNFLGFWKEKIEGKIEIHYTFYLINHSRTDYDNLIKITQDMLVNRGYLVDDSKIYKAIIEKIPSKEDKIIIEIMQYV